MAIRVLPRRPFRSILFEIPRIPSIHSRNFRFFSLSPDIRSRIPSESPEKSQFTLQISLASVLQRYGFPQSQLHEFIQKNRFLLNSPSSDVHQCIKILLSFGLSQKSLLSTLFSCPWVLNLGFLGEWQLALTELGFSSISPSLIQRVLQQSGRFRIEPDDFRRNAEKMKALGFTKETVIRVFEVLPAGFMKDPIGISRRIEFLNDLGYRKDEMDRICYLYPEFLAYGVEGRLKPLFEEFRVLGFCRNEVRNALLDNPKLILGMEVGELSQCIKLVRSLKCRVPIKERILSKGPLRAGIDVKLRIDFLCKHGLIRRDAFKVLYLEPRSILYELGDLEMKIEFLLQKMGFSIEHLVEFPEYLGLNAEKQVIPRYNVIEHLKSKGGLCFEVGLKHFVSLSRLKFYNLYVKPYPECEKIFGGRVREAEVKRSRHPVGLWKLFQPERFPERDEDVRNMKMFMETLV